jgi:O-antigen/teichoic acid export membrane protein
MVPYGKHMTAMALLSVLSSQLDKIVLFVFFGPVSLASFWVASVLPQEVGRAVSLVVSAFFPRMVKVSKAEAVRTVKKIFSITLMVSFLASVIYYFLAPVIFNIFLPKYVEVVKMSSVLMFAYAVVPHLFVWNIFTARKNVRELYLYNLAEPILTISLYVSLIPIWGVWGLVWALLTRSLILNIVSVIVIIKYEKNF